MFRTYYSRPPFFMVITAPTAEALDRKVQEIDARLTAAGFAANSHRAGAVVPRHSSLLDLPRRRNGVGAFFGLSGCGTNSGEAR